MTNDPQILIVEIKPGSADYSPPAPGQMITALHAEQLPRGTRVILCLDGAEYPGTFHGMQWAIGDDEEPRRRAYVDFEEPVNGQKWWFGPAWFLRMAEVGS